MEFCHEPKSLDVVLNAVGDEIKCSENLLLRSPLKPLYSSFNVKGALETVEICVLYSQRFSNQFEIESKAPFNCDIVSRGL